MGRRKSQGMSINLFPFLSILVAIIGCLTLIIVVLNLTQMNKTEGQTPEAVTRAEEWKLVKKEKEDAQTELDKLRNLIETMIQENRDTITKRDKLQRLKEMKENQEEIDESRNELIAKINALNGAIKEFDIEFPKIEEKIMALMKELEKRDLPPEPPKLRVRPSGSGKPQFPYFVEAANNALLIHKSLTKEPTAIPLAGINQNKEFSDLLKIVSSKDMNRLIFLVRGSKESAGSYRRATKTIAAYNKEHQTTIIPGRLPLPAEGAVDLTPFKQYLRP